MAKVKPLPKQRRAVGRPPGKQAEKMRLQVQQSKKDLLLALEKSLGVVTTACKTVGLDRTTFYNYVNSDPEFAKAVKEIDSVAIDFAESQLYQQISNGIPSSTIFFLKTRGKDRGYIERSEMTGKDGAPIQVESKFDLSVLSDDELVAFKIIHTKLRNGGGS